MKDEANILRSALSGLFDIQAEPERVIVTAPGPLCDEFYRYLGQEHPESRKIMVRSSLELGQEIHFTNSSSDQVANWVHRFAQDLETSVVSECYHAIYPETN